MNDVLVTQPPPRSRAMRVVLVDPRPERRTLMRLMLETAETVASVVGEAGTRGEAVMTLDDLDVDAVVIEIQMPLEEGLRTIADVHTRTPRVGIVVCSFLDDHRTRTLAVAAGADRFLSKPVNGRDLVGALKELMQS